MRTPLRKKGGPYGGHYRNTVYRCTVLVYVTSKKTENQTPAAHPVKVSTQTVMISADLCQLIDRFGKLFCITFIFFSVLDLNSRNSLFIFFAYLGELALVTVT